MQRRLKNRLTYLWTFELANALLIFPGAYYSISLNYRLGWFSLVSLGVVCAILIVGAAFWFLKRRALGGADTLSRPSVWQFFRACKIGFGVVLVVLLVLFGIRVFGQGTGSRADLALGIALMLLAALEYINYYFVQLSYDNRADLRYLFEHRRLKRAVMVRELKI
jgi:hypothetical protein